MLSIAIPLYNKISFISKTIESCVKACEASSIDYEIVVSNNASSDTTQDEINALTSMHKKCRVVHLPCTISAGENWLAALNNCQGSHLKLQLADDPMAMYDLNDAISHMEIRHADYVLGLTQPIFESPGFTTQYYDYVNPFRRRITPTLSGSEKIDMILEDMIHSRNPFGDINALIFHRDCLKSLNQGVMMGLSAFGTFPDLDIFLTLFACHNGAFLDEVTSFFVYNDTSPAVRRETTSELKLKGAYDEYESVIPLHFIASLRLKPLTDQLSAGQKRDFWRASQVRINQVLGIADSDWPDGAGRVRRRIKRILQKAIDTL